MNKKALYVVAFLSFAASAGMYLVGSTNGHLTELLDFFWIPVPLGVIAIIATFKKEEA